MSKFEVYKLPGGELVIQRTLSEKEDGVDDETSIMLHRPEIDILVKELISMGRCGP